MTAFLDIYWTLFKTGLAVQFQYRAAMAIYLLGMVIQPVVYLVVWGTVAEAKGGSVGGMLPADFAAYYITLMVVNHLTFTWNMFEFEYRIRTGEFSVLLLQPLHPIHQDLARNVSYKILTLVIMIPATIVLVIIFRPTLSTPRWCLGVFLSAFALAFAVRFMLEWTLALVAFWTTRTAAINQVYFAASFFLGGRVAPLELMPDWLRNTADLLPFRYMTAFPVELILGRLDPTEAIRGLTIQILWLFAAVLIVSSIWGLARKHYTAVGS